MSHFLRKLLLTVTLTASLAASPHDFEVDGIYYDIISSTENTVAVTYEGSSPSLYSEDYTGTVVIPPSVEYNGTTYSVTAIGNTAFYGCSGLTSVTIPNSVTSIGGAAFAYCNGIKSVHINSLESWYAIYFEDDHANPLTSAHHLFLNGEEIKNLQVPESITYIKDYAFSGCSGLTSVTIPNSVTSIGNSAFFGCSELKSVHINSLDSWCEISFGDYNANPLRSADHLFLKGEEIKNLQVPESISSINDYAFYGCNGLTSVTIPNTVVVIGKGAFSGCSSLSNLLIEDGLGTLSFVHYDYTGFFRDCPLETVHIGRNLSYNTNSNLESLFSHHKNLTNLTIGKMVTQIRDYAFYECSGLKKLQIEDSPETLSLGSDNTYPSNIFYNCPLETVHIGRNLSYRTDYPPFRNRKELMNLTIGNTVTRIGAYAFDGCSKLKSIEIPPSVTEIGTRGFGNCNNFNLIKLKSPNLILGDECFKNCTEVIKMESYAETPPECYYQALSSVNKSLCKLYVPKGCGDQYREAYQWMEFENIYDTLDPVAGVDELTADTGDSVVDVFDASGICVKHSVHYDALRSLLSPGLYIVRTLDGKVKKVIIK